MAREDDDTQNIVRLRKGSEDPVATLRDVVSAIRHALEARAAKVAELGQGVEYEAQLARERLQNDGIEADLSAIRVGEYFKRMTEFNLLQRIYRAVQARSAGFAVRDSLDPDADD